MARGNKAYVVTEENRRIVQMMTAAGVTQEGIALCIGCSIDTLERHFRRELDTAVDELNTKVAGSLLKSALGGNTAAQIFWLKTRARWRETDRIEHTGADGSPLNLGSSAVVIVKLPDNGRDA